MGVENITLINTDSFMFGVREVIIGVIIGFIVLVIGYLLIERRREANRIKREEERIQKEKFEQEQNKRREELKNNIREHNQKLITEINNWIKNNFASVYYEPLAKKHLEEYGDIRELYKEFDKGFRDIISDFEERKIELKSTCEVCKDWHDELKSLNNQGA